MISPQHSFFIFYAKMTTTDPYEVAGKCLFQHQITAVEWMQEREADPVTCGGFLCDEMGLGKTLTVLGLLTINQQKRTLILGPLAVLHQWKTACIAGGFAVAELECGAWNITGDEGQGVIHLANYDKLSSNPLAFTLNFRRIVFDEAHNIRNGESERYKTAAKLRARRKWFLTGTPIVNGLSDFASLLKLLNPVLLVTSVRQAEEVMATYALGRRVDQVRAVLPGIFPNAPTVKRHVLDFRTEEEAKFYRSVQGILQEELEGLIAADRLDLGAFMTLILRLRQISVHPQVYIEAKRRALGAQYTRADWLEASTKTDMLLKVLRAEKTPRGFVIFCNFHDEMKLLKGLLERERVASTIELYHGGMSASQRQKAIEATEVAMRRTAFSSASDVLLRSRGPLGGLCYDVLRQINTFVGGQHVILLAQLQSAGTGLNLQHMNRVVFNTPWWTAALMDQAVGRVLRLGQMQDVEIHHILLCEEMENSLNIDKFMGDKAEAKRALCERLLASAIQSI